MKLIPKFFNKPHPFIFNAYSIATPSIVSFVIIVVLAPFQFREVGMLDRIMAGIIISTLVALGVFLSVKGLKKLLPNKMSEDQWTVGKEFLLFLLVLCNIVFLILIAFLIFKPNKAYVLTLFLDIASTTVAISILPILVLILFEQYRHQKTQLKKATALTDSLKIHNDELLTSIVHEEANKQQALLIKSESNDIELQLNQQDLIYVKSDGNYVDIHYFNIDKIQKKTIRNRLKRLEDSLPNEVFFRCHNSFIVNGIHIIKVQGNARNLMLHLKGIPTSIPVSRAKASILSAFLENLQKQ